MTCHVNCNYGGNQEAAKVGDWLPRKASLEYRKDLLSLSCTKFTEHNIKLSGHV